MYVLASYVVRTATLDQVRLPWAAGLGCLALWRRCGRHPPVPQSRINNARRDEKPNEPLETRLARLFRRQIRSKEETLVQPHISLAMLCRYAIDQLQLPNHAEGHSRSSHIARVEAIGLRDVP